MMGCAGLGCSGSRVVARPRSNDTNTLALKDQKDGFTQRLGFAKVSPFYLCNRRLERFLLIR